MSLRRCRVGAAAGQPDNGSFFLLPDKIELKLP